MKYNNLDGKSIVNFSKFIGPNKKIFDDLGSKSDTFNLKFSSIHEFNDPIEAFPELKLTRKLIKRYQYEGITLPSVKDYLVRKLEEVHKNYLVLCLSRNPTSYKMWNYYSNGHKGIVLVFKDDAFKDDFLRKYQATHVKVTYKVRTVRINEKFKNPNEKLKAIFGYKTRHWKYENEERIIVEKSKLKSIDKFYFAEIDKNSIDSIIFGVGTESTVKEQLLNRFLKADVEFFQAYIVFNDRQKIHLKHICKNNTQKYLLRGRNDFIVDQRDLIKIPTNVSDLNDLPEYKNNENYKKCVDEYLDNYRNNITNRSS